MLYYYYYYLLSRLFPSNSPPVPFQRVTLIEASDLMRALSLAMELKDLLLLHAAKRLLVHHVLREI
jgi:hypothetical protein